MKSKRGKKLLILLGALLLSIGLFFLTKTILEKPEDETKAADETFSVLSFKEADVVELDWVYGENSFQIVKTEGGWQLKNEPDAKVKDSTMEYILSSFSDVLALKKTAAPDPEAMGISAPSCIAEVKLEDGSFAKGVFGALTPGQQEVYFSNGDGEIYIVDTRERACFSFLREDILEVPEETSQTDPGIS